MLSHIADAVSRFVPMAEGAGEEDRNWLVYSGVKMTASSFWAFRVISLTGGVVAGLFAAASLADPLRSVSVFILCVILGSQIPMFYIAARRAEWRRQLDEDLPDALDLMAVAVSAGSTFESALRVVAERMDGKLAESFEDVVEESRYSSRNRALANFAARSGVESLQIFAASLAQAEASGAPLLDILQEQASSARTMRRLHIEEKANALQVKMLMPMLMFVFPVLVIILCAPLIGQVLTMLG
ncbi:type II secretion system F family protein [Eggerthella timonensis]|uniref:type II secretion system F family protein n=1 Tax=Eggerthella timonensis TaxID=1871008 RepID=UPI0015E0B545|nr:type II secretion system F family protein [Eggerthella timonensis]